MHPVHFKNSKRGSTKDGDDNYTYPLHSASFAPIPGKRQNVNARWMLFRIFQRNFGGIIFATIVYYNNFIAETRFSVLPLFKKTLFG